MFANALNQARAFHDQYNPLSGISGMKNHFEEPKIGGHASPRAAGILLRGMVVLQNMMQPGYGINASTAKILKTCDAAAIKNEGIKAKQEAEKIKPAPTFKFDFKNEEETAAGVNRLLGKMRDIWSGIDGLIAENDAKEAAEVEAAKAKIREAADLAGVRAAAFDVSEMSDTEFEEFVSVLREGRVAGAKATEQATDATPTTPATPEANVVDAVVKSETNNDAPAKPASAAELAALATQHGRKGRGGNKG